MLIGIVVAVAIGALLGKTSYERAAWAATLLELAGLAKVAWDLHEVRKAYARPSIVEEITTWARDLPALFRPPKGKVISAEAGEYFVVGERASVSIKPGPNSTLEQRVKLLEEELVRVRDHAAAEHHLAWLIVGVALSTLPERLVTATWEGVL